MSKDNTPNIPGMNLNPDKYSTEKPIVSPENTEKIQKEMEKTKKELDKLKSWVVKNYKFTKSISILPPQAIPLFIEEEEIPKQAEKHLQLYMVVPEDKFKEIPIIQKEILKEVEKIKGQKIWLQIKTPVDIWELCLDSKFDMSGAIAMSYPLFDTGFLGALRMSEIHKTLVLRKFEKYVVSYVIAGSFLRGDATSTSDVDVFIIINDTDVKKMPRLELRERLRNIIYQYVAEAAALAGVKNTLHIQPYLLTDFWESVKDASPVIFTFIRDGIPIYDRNTFMPWKALLRMGKLKPSPEAIDMFMKTADKTKEMVDRRLVDSMVDLYWGVLTPSQALIMLYGLPPPIHKDAYKIMEEIFVEKEKMLKKTDIAILDKLVKSFKEFEHDPKYNISGKEIDELVKDSEEYLKKLKELRKKIEKSSQEKTIEQIYKDVMDLLKNVTGKTSQDEIVKSFEKNFVKRGKFTNHHLKILKEIITAKEEFKKGKLSSHNVDEARKSAGLLTNDLIDFTQRCELVFADKGKLKLRYKEGVADIVKYGKDVYLIRGNVIKKITSKVEDSNAEELNKSFEGRDKQASIEIDSKAMDLIRKELGSFEIIL